MEPRNFPGARILILAPTGRDAGLLQSTLTRAGISVLVCEHFDALLMARNQGAAAAVVAEESLSSTALDKIACWLASQPHWSDLPLVVLTSGGKPSLRTIHKAHELERLGNVTLLERPVRPDTVLSAARAALRARNHQYQMRQHQMRQHQEKLTQVNRDLEQFAYSASHDLQEPLRTVSIYSELLSQQYSHVLDEEGQMLLGYVNTGATRMAMLVRDLLAYTQAAATAEEVSELQDAGEQLHATLESLAELIRSTESRITSDPLPAVRMKGVHLQQLFQNLIENAIKYRADEPPRIHISARRELNCWQFSVRDNGIGIEPQFHEHIFGIFKRLHTNAKFPGTGIGLAVCQRIVERYGGRIWVESERGKGSDFLFTVPAD
jgi:signal transduction histidine kinase